MATFTREQLYDRVWSQSTVQLAKELGVSDVTIAKTCKKFQIPKPSLGYWAKVEHGHKVLRPPLPTVDDPRLQRISIEPVPEWLREEPISDSTSEKMNAEKSVEKRIVVAGNLESPHPLVRRSIRALRSMKPDREGLVHTAGGGLLDMSVGIESIDRAMKLMDALLKAVESRGMTVSVEDKPVHWTTIVEVDGERFSLRLSESLGERERPLTAQEKQENRRYEHYKPYPTVEKHPRGLFSITAQGSSDSYVQKRWSELDGKRLETRLNSIVAWLYRGADRVKERRARFAERDRQWKEEELRRAEAEELRRKEDERIEQLERQVAAWHHAEQIRLFADAVERAVVAKRGSICEGSDMDIWLHWVRVHAASVDPIQIR